MLKIDGKEVEIKKSGTILEVARDADIYIPTLCTLKELPAFGACRLCLVKIEGMRGYPPACTTPASDGMVITTNDEELNDLRRKILELLLSEHPNSCILCEDAETCAKYRTCPMKVGQITGCQLCPNKEHCELKDVIEYLGIEKVDYDFEYKDMDVERSDPFFDRDYNLCILCGRCVRVCEDIRGMGVLAFTNRGHETRIDTSFGKSHLELGCKFCGACVDVCPTGALSARATKWHGEPDATVSTVCGLCNINCGIVAGVKWGKLVETTPDSDSYTNGQLCVLGRFCIATITNHFERLKYPLVRKDDWLIPVDWDEAVESAVEGLKNYQPQDVGFILSSDLSNEAAFTLLELARALGTENIAIASDASSGFGGGNESGVSALCQLSGFDEEKLMKPEEIAGLKAVYTTQHLAAGGIATDSGAAAGGVDTDGSAAADGIATGGGVATSEKPEFLIVQDVFESGTSKAASIVLPALSFIETDGTTVSFDGTLRILRAAPEPYARARPDWKITNDILKGLGKEAIFETHEDVRSAFENGLKELPQPELQDLLSEKNWLPKMLKERNPSFSYRGVDLTRLMDDLKTVWEAV